MVVCVLAHAKYRDANGGQLGILGESAEREQYQPETLHGLYIIANGSDSTAGRDIGKYR
jgi:hypothetical protein